MEINLSLSIYGETQDLYTNINAYTSCRDFIKLKINLIHTITIDINTNKIKKPWSVGNFGKLIHHKAKQCSSGCQNHTFQQLYQEVARKLDSSGKIMEQWISLILHPHKLRSVPLELFSHRFVGIALAFWQSRYKKLKLERVIESKCVYMPRRNGCLCTYIEDDVGCLFVQWSSSWNVDNVEVEFI